MYESDDRLAGDLVWELFPARAVGPGALWSIHDIPWLEIVVTTFLWFVVSPPLAVVFACAGASLPSLLATWRQRTSLPDEAGRTIRTLFGVSWAAWKIGVVAVVVLCLGIVLTEFRGFPTPGIQGIVVAVAFGFLGFLASAALTTLGLVKAVRSGMKVWIGEGMNQARVLLLTMLLVLFAFLILIPMTIIGGLAATSSRPLWIAVLFAAVLMGLMFIAPVLILIILDRISRRVLADQTGTFKPRAPMIGKWDEETLLRDHDHHSLLPRDRT